MNNLENLKNYEYNCKDDSILTKYVLRHIYDYIVQRLPVSIAPNTLTLFGLISSFVSFVITVITDPTLENQRFPIVKLINLILLFMYQIFDAIDGKQARRTRSSSPLGQLFDHGCDALVCFFTAITISSSLGIGISMNLFLFLYSFIWIYYLCALEEYSTDLFYLGYINGPSEGIFSGIMAHLISLIFGTKVFYILKIKVFTNITTMSAFLIVFLILSTIVSLATILKNRKNISLKELFYSITNVYCLLMSGLLYNFAIKDVFFKYVSIFALMFIFSSITIDIAYSHLKKSKISSPDFNYYLYIFVSPFYDNNDKMKMLLGLLFLSAALNYSTLVKKVIDEICGFLKIRCFVIKEVKQE